MIIQKWEEIDEREKYFWRQDWIRLIQGINVRTSIGQEEGLPCNKGRRKEWEAHYLEFADRMPFEVQLGGLTFLKDTEILTSWGWGKWEGV